MSKALKPMLASLVEDFTKLKFPAYVSPKLDGVRCTVWDGKLYSRSLKLIPNVNVQTKFAGLPDGSDGELIVGEPNDDPFRRTMSVVMSEDKPATDVRFYQFDRIVNPDRPFRARYQGAGGYAYQQKLLSHYIVPQILVSNLHDLEVAEEQFLSEGYEGLMYRDPEGRYKHGRSSEKEQILLKVKRFRDGEAIVTGVFEEMENQNESFTNELGRTARSSAKDGKVGKGQLGGFHCRGVGGDYDGIEFDVSTSSVVHTLRKLWWEDHPETHLVGQLLTYKYFPTGGDKKPRQPVFKGWRDGRDL